MAYTDADTLNYRGELYLIGNYRTPFLTMIGGLNGGMRSSSFLFPLAQPYALNTASQDTQSEDTAASAGTATTYTRAEDTNTVQIMKKDAEVTFKKQSTYGQMSGINTMNGNPVTNELSFQKSAALRQMAIDVEYSFLQGTYLATVTSATNATTRGIITASSAGTNTVDAASAGLSKALVDALLLEMYTNGSIFQNPVIFVNGFQKQKITDIYGYAPEDRNIGGLNVNQIETDFGRMGVVTDAFMPTDTLLIAEMSVCRPVFVPVSFDGEEMRSDIMGADVAWVKTALTAAKNGGFYYTQIGLDYGPEEYHGTLTGLATS